MWLRGMSCILIGRQSGSQIEWDRFGREIPAIKNIAHFQLNMLTNVLTLMV